MSTIEDLRAHLKELRSKKDGLEKAKQRAEESLVEANKTLARVNKELPQILGYIEGTLKKLRAHENDVLAQKRDEAERLRKEIAVLEAGFGG